MSAWLHDPGHETWPWARNLGCVLLFAEGGGAWCLKGEDDDMYGHAPDLHAAKLAAESAARRLLREALEELGEEPEGDDHA